jgi:hypothetical protein
VEDALQAAGRDRRHLRGVGHPQQPAADQGGGHQQRHQSQAPRFGSGAGGSGVCLARVRLAHLVAPFGSFKAPEAFSDASDVHE